MASDIRAEVYAIVGDVFLVAPEDIDPSRTWEELGAGSFDLVEFIVALRESFGLDIEPSELTKVRTLDDVVAYVEARQEIRPKRGDLTE